MPEAITEPITNAYPSVTWVNRAVADAIIEDVDNGQAVLVAVNSLRELAPDVRGVKVGLTHGGFHGQITQSSGFDLLQLLAPKFREDSNS